MTATQDAPTPTAHSWPPGLPRSLDYPAVPVGSILRAAVRRWGDRTAFLQHDVPLTFTELGRRAHAVAGWLNDSGIGRGDLAAQLADAGARVLITWDQVLPLVRGAVATTPVETVVVTGEAHARDFAARL